MSFLATNITATGSRACSSFLFNGRAACTTRRRLICLSRCKNIAATTSFFSGGPRRTIVTTPAQAGKRAEELAMSTSNNGHATSSSWHLDTLLSHAGISHNSGTNNNNIALAPSLEFATTYTRPSEGPYQEGDSIYARHDNPTRMLLEQTVFDMECSGINNVDNDNGCSRGLVESTTCAFASGLMAASSIVLAHSTPLTVLLPQDLYHGVSTVMTDVFKARFNVTVEHVDMTELQTLTKQLEQYATNTGSNNSIILWMESPSNPKCHVLDIANICATVEHARATTKAEITTVVDSTMAPPVIQQPLELGADLVMHSGTKYMGGHSDVLLGLVTASPYTARGKELAPLLRQVQIYVGGVASPMDSWLALRGLRTLHVRVQRQCQTALRLAKHFESLQQTSSSLIKAVHYPGLKSHPNHHVATQQMKLDIGYGGVLSVELESEHMAMAFCGALQTIYRATSLGGTETLIEHRASIEPPERVTSPPGLLRMTVGLEDVSDLLRDIGQALVICKQVKQEMS